MILSAPKTGNTWLRWLLHYAYGIPIVELPLEWAPGKRSSSETCHAPTSLPQREPRPMVGRERSRRPHDNTPPAATFLSLFHYVKWHDTGSDPTTAMLNQDGDRPGKNALNYITYWFPQSYAISLAWPKLRSHLIRYEDLLVDPLLQLREVTSKVVPLDEERLKAADCQRRFVRVR